MFIINIYEKLTNLRVDFKNTKVVKSGENKFQNFKYLELSDFLPIVMDLNQKYGLYTHINIVNGLATLDVVDIDDPESVISFNLSVPEVNKVQITDDGINVPAPFNGMVQDTGKLETYIRRYLYMLYCEIAVPDEIDNNSVSKKSRGSRPKGRGKPFVKPQ